MAGRKKSKCKAIYDALLTVYGPQKCFLDHETPFQLLCAVILSAQCTDKKVNTVTPELFRRYPDAAALADADAAELETILHPCGFYHAKGKYLREMAAILRDEYAGEVPDTMEELTRLPGVGRKTANVVLGDSMGVPGLPVDTHVLRLSGRLGLSRSADPVKVEQDLCKELEPEYWAQFSHLLIVHGRNRCTARRADCINCEISGLCAGITKEKSL